MAAKATKKEKTKKTGWQPKVSLSDVYVDNPYYSKDHEEQGANPIKIKAQINIKESAIVTLAARKHINEAQLAAANRFRGLWESLGGSGAPAFDYSREPVDGGGVREPLTERQVRAGLELKECRDLVGVKCFRILENVIGQGYNVGDLVASQRDRKTYMDYLRDGLDILATKWRLAR